MSVLRSHDGWKTKHFKGMTLEEIKAKFDPVWRRIQDFIPIGSKEEAERLKRKGLRLEPKSAKKLKTLEGVPEGKLKEMMQLVPVEEVYVEALQRSRNIHASGEGLPPQERNKMHKAFLLPVKTSHCQKKFPLLVKKVPPAEEKRCHCCEVRTATEVNEEHQPLMLEKGNYILWESRFKRFLDNMLEEGERMWNSIQNGPYQRRMIANPINPADQILERLSKMTEGNKKQYVYDVRERIKRLMHRSEITTHVRHSRLMDKFDKFVAIERESLDFVYERLTTLVNIMDCNNVCPIPVSINTKFLNCLQPEWQKYVTMFRHNTGDKVSYDVLYDSLVQFEPHVLASTTKKAAKNHDPLALIAHSNASSSQSHANSSYSSKSYYVTYPPSIDDYDDEYQGDSQKDKLTTAMINQAVVQDGRVDIQTKNARYFRNANKNAGRNRNQVFNAGNCYNCNEKGHYARECSKPKVHDAKYIREQMLLAIKDEFEIHHNNEENDFMLDNAYGEERLDELTASVMLMARIQPADRNTEHVPSSNAKVVSQVDDSSKAHEQVGHVKSKTIIHTSDDDQIDSSFMFDDPHVEINGVESSNSVRRLKSKDNKSKNNVLKNTKSSSTYVWKTTSSAWLNSNKCETKTSNDCQTNACISNSKTVTAINDCSNIVRISCGNDVFLHSHKKCVARHALSKKFSVKTTLFTFPLAARSKNFGATSVVIKSRLSIAKTPTATIGQFYDGDLEVAFHTNTCYVQNLDGDDLLTGSRDSNLYTIFIFEMTLLLCSNNLVDGIPKVKYNKDHLCSTYEHGKSKKASLPPKLVPSTKSKIKLLHMDLCGPIRVASINGKKYIFVIVDDYSRKPNIQYFHVFGSLCYRTNNRDDLGKMKPKVDIELGMNCINFNDSSEDSQSIPLKSDLDNLFGPLYDEYYATSSQELSDNSAANTLDNDHTSSSSSIVVEQDDAP
nr:hypothetical protein [Tanacetum cinerariifolium]